MTCWNGLSPRQQTVLIRDGVLPFGQKGPEGGTCTNGAEVAIETWADTSPGPRFYCLPCAIVFLQTERGTGFTCPRCGAHSHHPTDRVERYCGACHDWVGL